MPHLQGKSIVALFYENSTRTRLSFELAASTWGATFSNLGVSSSSVNKGETLLDTARPIEAMENGRRGYTPSYVGRAQVSLRQLQRQRSKRGRRHARAPRRRLLDMFTMKEKFSSISDSTFR
jgi:aspartate carbamoyltransferase catalytic subunit